MPIIVAIKRTDRADRSHWVPLVTKNGYQLVDRKIPYPDRNYVKSATFKTSLDDAAHLIKKGFAIRMAKPGAKRGDYIYPEDIEIV